MTDPRASDIARRYDLIVFDWDGTIMDSLGAIVECAQVSLRELELPEVPAERIRGGIGLGLDATVERLLPDETPGVRRRWVKCYRHHWIETYHARPAILPGAEETVRSLHGEEYWLAVATGKSRRGLERDLDLTGMGELFLSTRTVDEAPSKPHPRMLLDLMDELGVRAERTLMIGDTTYDLEMARNAGVTGVGVLTGGHDRETLLGVDAVACLDAASDLPRWLAEGASQGAKAGNLS